MRTLIDSCKPRPSVFDKARLDTVYNLDDLSSIHPDEFLSENYVTEGMRILLTEAFNRLEGKTTSASGTFLLSQSMGGGKTHNLITLGLLAKYQKYRKQVMADFFKPGELKGRDLSGEGFAGSLLRQILFGVYKTAEEDDPRPGLDYLKQEISNYWDRRQTIIALLNYLSQKPSPAMTHWKKDVEAAHLLLGAVEGDGV